MSGGEIKSSNDDFMPAPHIRQALGQDSEKTTEIYLKELDNSEVDALNEKIGHFQPVKGARREEKRAIFAAKM